MSFYTLDDLDANLLGAEIGEFYSDSTDGSIAEFEDNSPALAEVDEVNKTFQNVDNYQKNTRRYVWAVLFGQILVSLTAMGLTHNEIRKAFNKHIAISHMPMQQALTRSQTPPRLPEKPKQIDFGKIPEKSIEDLYKATVYLILKSESKDRFTIGTCAGIILDNGVIATAKHCVDKGQYLVTAIKRKSKKDDSVRVAWYLDKDDPVAIVKHPTLDLALIGNPKLMKKLKPYGMKTGSDAELEKVVLTLGHPTGRKLFTPSTGVLSKKTKDKYELRVNILPGNSGGGVINTKGEIVGIIAQSIGEVYPDKANAVRLSPKDLEILNQKLFHEIKKLKPRKKKSPWFDMECKKTSVKGSHMKMKCKYPKKKKSKKKK
ncbi:serine protease [Patescibacteria group bacterium]